LKIIVKSDIIPQRYLSD